MSQTGRISQRLLEADDCFLLLVDIQQPFLEKLPPGEGERLVGRIGWMLDVAVQLGIPVIAMAEDIPRHGAAVEPIRRRLPDGSSVHNKMIFGLAANKRIMAAIEACGRQTAVLAGLETDVCVAQSALGLLAQGYEVVVLRDGTASPDLGHETGIERMRSAGVLIGTVKSVYYEWVRGVAKDDALRERILGGGPLPPGLAL